MGNCWTYMCREEPISIFKILKEGNTAQLCEYLKHPVLRNILKTQIDNQPTMIVEAVGICTSQKCMDIVIKEGCNVNETNESNWSALHEAIRKGNWSMVPFLVDKGANLFCCTKIALSKSYKDGERYHVPFTLTVEEWGTSYRHRYMSLLPYDVDKRDLNPDPKVEKSMGMSIKGFTMLMYACMSGSLVAVKILVEDCRADVNRAASCGIIPIQAAMICGHTHIVAYLQRKTDLTLCRWSDPWKQKMALKRLLYTENFWLPELILKSSVNVEALVSHDGTFMSPVMVATIDDRIEPFILMCLLSYGANINWVHSRTKRTALWWAVLKNQVDKVRIILEARPDMFLTSIPAEDIGLARDLPSRSTVMQLALRKENPIIIEMLVDAGCDLHHIDIHSNLDILHRYKQFLKPETVAKFQRCFEMPVTLTETAKNSVRKAIGYEMVQYKISTLAIPESVKQYLYQVRGRQLFSVRL